MNLQWFNKQRRRVQCQLFSSKLSEYVDGTLDRDLMWQIKNHVAVCASCMDVVDSLNSIARLLGLANRHEVSSNFSGALEARIAALPRKTAQATGSVFANRTALSWPKWSSAPVRLTGSFAAAAMVLIGLLVFMKPPSVPVSVMMPPAPAVVRISDLVDQHREQSAGDPLSDASAQLLASSVDTIKVDPAMNHKLSDDDAAVLVDEEM